MCCKTEDIITLAHGGGGIATMKLIEDIILHRLGRFGTLQDAAVLDEEKGRIAFTTDSFVVSPVFFSGGNVGKLAVCGTVNDLACVGAIPKYLSCGLIIEEGFKIKELDEILKTMSDCAYDAGVKIVCGDTKVVPKGKCDGIYINTSGIGIIADGINISTVNAQPGDAVILTGPLGEHGATIMAHRNRIESEIKSDCASLHKITQRLLEDPRRIKALRDPTRGGAAMVLNEIAGDAGVGIEIQDDWIPQNALVEGICSILGLDPLYLANEGKLVIISPQQYADEVVTALGGKAAVIGKVVNDHTGKVVLHTRFGGKRLIDMPYGDQFPRIC